MMTNKDNGGPAFPCQYQGDTRSDASGLSMRDYFAAKAMQAAFSFALNAGLNMNTEVAKSAYEVADAMLEARK